MSVEESVILRPVANAGSLQLDPVPSENENWQNIAEPVLDIQTYNAATAQGELSTDHYALAEIVAPSSKIARVVVHWEASVIRGSGVIGPFLSIGGTLYDDEDSYISLGSVGQHSGSYSYPVNPATGHEWKWNDFRRASGDPYVVLAPAIFLATLPIFPGPEIRLNQCYVEVVLSKPTGGGPSRIRIASRVPRGL